MHLLAELELNTLELIERSAALNVHERINELAASFNIARNSLHCVSHSGDRLKMQATGDPLDGNEVQKEGVQTFENWTLREIFRHECSV